ncbi:MAG: Hsp20/alpha crystallin family protein [Fimbriimonadaceae bacterium]|nr:Hsp20/alpha crystallin family protein [Fimbriimonadaceae bacterium]
MPRREVDEWILELDTSFSSREVGLPKIARQRGWMPHIDLLEAPTHLLIRAELAGVVANQIHLTLNQSRHSLVLRGERPDDLSSRPERYQAHLLEIDEGAFFREVVLPQGSYNFKQMSAGFKNGILTIIIPKQDQDDVVLVVEQITLKRL